MLNKSSPYNIIFDTGTDLKDISSAKESFFVLGISRAPNILNPKWYLSTKIQVFAFLLFSFCNFPNTPFSASNITLNILQCTHT